MRTKSDPIHGRAYNLWSTMTLASRLIQHTLLIVLTAHTAAQTFVVDAANGPGASFTDLPAAIATVPDGAILVVRPGGYTQFSIDGKSLSILADTAVTVGSIGQSCFVRNLGAQQQVTLRGMQFLGSITNTVVRCLDNDGPVLIDSCWGAGLYPTNGCAIEATRCIDVHIRNGTFRTANVPLLCIDSFVRATNATFEVASSYPGVAAFDGTVELNSCTVLGATGAPGRGAVNLNNSNLRVLGASNLSTTFPWWVVTGSGNARIDPATVFNNGGWQPTINTVNTTMLQMPSVTADPGIGSNLAAATLEGPAAGIGVLFAGLRSSPLLVSWSPDPILLLPGSEVLLASGSLSAPLNGSYIVPLSPVITGVRVVWQGASLEAASGLQLSNAVTYVHM